MGIVRDRHPLREARVNPAIRWFVGYALHEDLPEHSSLTRIRQRWGEETFRQVFTQVVRQCREAGLITAETVHMDATLIHCPSGELAKPDLPGGGDASMDSLVAQHLDAVDEVNDAERLSRASGKHEKHHVTDPDASMATSSKAPLRPSCKQHSAVDGHVGVVADVEIVTGEEHDTGRSSERVDVMQATPGKVPARITADAACGTGQVHSGLEEREVEYVIPHSKPVRRADTSGFPIERFKYDARKDVVRCPNRKTLTPRNTTRAGRWYRAVRQDRAGCPFKARCISATAFPRKLRPAACTSRTTSRPSCALAANENAGEEKSAQSIPGTGGASKEPTGQRKHSMD